MNKAILGAISMTGSAAATVFLIAFAYVVDTAGSDVAKIALCVGMGVALFVAAMALLIAADMRE